VAAASAPQERNDWNASRVDTAPKAWTRPRGRYHHHVSSLLPIPISSSYTYHRHSFRHLAMPSSAFFLRAGLALVSFTNTIHQASAQDTTSSSSSSTAQTATPIGTWRPRPTCINGGDASYNGGYGGGGYTDKFGGLWDARCSYTLPQGVALTVGQTGGTNGQGWYGCAKGCAKRPTCTAFQFNANYASGTVPRSSFSDTVGAGTCLYFSAAGQYTLGDPASTNLYGATHLIRANTQLPVSQRRLFPESWHL